MSRDSIPTQDEGTRLRPGAGCNLLFNLCVLTSTCLFQIDSAANSSSALRSSPRSHSVNPASKVHPTFPGPVGHPKWHRAATQFDAKPYIYGSPHHENDPRTASSSMFVPCRQDDSGSFPHTEGGRRSPTRGRTWVSYSGSSMEAPVRGRRARAGVGSRLSRRLEISWIYCPLVGYSDEILKVRALVCVNYANGPLLSNSELSLPKEALMRLRRVALTSTH